LIDTVDHEERIVVRDDALLPAGEGAFDDPVVVGIVNHGDSLCWRDTARKAGKSLPYEVEAISIPLEVLAQYPDEFLLDVVRDVDLKETGLSHPK